VQQIVPSVPSRRLRRQIMLALLLAAAAGGGLLLAADALGAAGAAVLCLLIFAPAAYGLARLIAGPLEKAAAAAAAIDPSNPATLDIAALTALAETKGEVGPLARTLSGLASAVSERTNSAAASAAAARQADERLREAIENISEGFVMFDANERHVLHNRRYQEIYNSDVDDNSEIGQSFEQILRRDLSGGRYSFAETSGDAEAWLALRLRKFREAKGTIEQKLENGRWVRVTDRRTPAGNTVGIRTDITAEKTAQLRLQEAHEESSRKSERLGAVVGQATEGVSAIKQQTAQLTSGAHDLSTRTDEQVASLQQMAAAIRQLAVTQSHSTERMDQAKQIFEGARTAAQSGSAAAASTIAAMQRIEESSQRIGEIIGLIEEIAFQTNLLALNAAVEAARAGEAGRGFAVVATEVRALAHRAGTASKEVRTLIANSRMEVADGVQLVNKSAATLELIVASVRRAADMIGEIAASSREQSDGVRQVDDSVGVLESLTQKNAELVEGTSAAVAAVDGQIEALMQVIGGPEQEGVRRIPTARPAA
jgi:methyl-accepting chemotaxis protein